MNPSDYLSIFIRLAKVGGGPVRADRIWADGFATQAGIGSLVGATWDSVDKKIVPNFTPGADQTKVLGSPIESGHFNIYTAARAFDGNAATQWMSPQYNQTQVGNAWLGWDFGAGQARDITSMTIRQDALSGPYYSQPINSVKLQWLNDLLAWIDIGIFPLVANTSLQTMAWASVGARRAFRALANANTALTGYTWGVGEMGMFLAASYANFVLTGEPQFSPSVVSSAGVEIEVNSVGAVDLSQDFGADVTCNDGGSWSNVPLVQVPGQGGRTLLVGAPVPCAPGNHFNYRAYNLNNKRIEVAGAAVDAS